MSLISFEFPPSDNSPQSDDPDLRSYDQEFDGSRDVLTEYVQPNSTLSLRDAVNQTAQFWNDQHPSGTIAALVASIAVAEQIPYDHPSQKKLAEFVAILVESEEVKIKMRHTHEGKNDVWWLFYNYLQDDLVPPETSVKDGAADDCTPYMNLCAFVANLTFADSHEPRFYYTLAKTALKEALEMDPTYAAQVRDTRVIGAAQHILFQSQAIHHEAMENQKCERELELEEANTWVSRFVPHKLRQKPDWKTDLKRERKRRLTPGGRFTLDEWQAWKQMFRTAASDQTHGGECRAIAQRAADLMALQEKVEDDRSAGP